MKYIKLFAMFAMALGLSLPALAGNPTLRTITVDGTMSDWAEVLSNPIQVTTDGVSSDPCTLSVPPDRDCPVQSTGRDLDKFAWTYDSNNIYLYVERVGSSSNSQEFLYFMDTGQDKRMNFTDFVLVVSWKGSNRSTGATLYRYSPKDSTNGDPMVDSSGFADGYSMPGQLGSAVWSDYSKVGGSESGLEMECYVPWVQLGVPYATPIYYHVSASNNTKPSTAQENLGGPGGGIGSFGFYEATLAPDNTGNAIAGSSLFFTHTLSNTGSFDDVFTLSFNSSMGYAVALTVDGTPVSSGYQLSLVRGASATIGVEVTTAALPSTAVDTTTLYALSEGDGFNYSVTDTTYIGDVTLGPDGSLSTAERMSAVFDHTLTNNLSGDLFNFTASSSQGFRLDLYIDGVLAATDLTGDGTWESITSGYDQDGNGLPDVNVANGASLTVSLSVVPPAGTADGTVDIATLQATGSTNGGSDSATDTTTVAPRLTVEPSYLISDSTNLYGGAGKSVYFAHTLTNSASIDDYFNFYASGYEPSSSAGYTVTIYSDPNGDGNPSDGSPVTGTGLVPRSGGVFHFIVKVDVPSSVAPPATDSTVATAVRCTDASCAGSDTTVTGSVTDETKVAYIVPFKDALRTLQASAFAPCSTLYVKAFNLVPAQSDRYSLIYRDPSGTTVRSVTIYSDNTGSSTDQYAFPADAPEGTYTIEIDDFGVALDTADVELQRSASIKAAVDPLGHELTGVPLVANATAENTNTIADYSGSRITYLVMDPSGTLYLQSDGSFASYTDQLTADHGPFDTAHGAMTPDTLSFSSVDFPSYGIYSICATWEASCGSDNTADDLASSCSSFYVVSWNSYSDVARTTSSTSFEVPVTAYLQGEGYGDGLDFIVALYDPDGNLVSTSSSTSSSGLLQYDADTSTLASLGGYRAAVYPSTAVPPVLFNGGDSTLVSVTNFDVTLASPVLDGPLSSGDTYVAGTSTAPAGSTVTLYVNGVSAATTTVQADGSVLFTLTTPLAEGDTVDSSVHVGAVDSAHSSPLTVGADTFSFNTPQTDALLNRADDQDLVTAGYQTTVEGTGEPGDTITVKDSSGNVVGSGTVAGDGSYSIIVTLQDGTSTDLTVTETDKAGNTSNIQHTNVGFDTRPNLLRNDSVASLDPVTPALSSFLTQVSPTAMTVWGANSQADRGEGALVDGNGSSDDDDFYVAALDNGSYDPDVTVAADTARPLVFYQFDTPGNTLRLAKETDGSGNLRIKISY